MLYQFVNRVNLHTALLQHKAQLETEHQGH